MKTTILAIIASIALGGAALADGNDNDWVDQNFPRDLGMSVATEYEPASACDIPEEWAKCAFERAAEGDSQED